ncbi:uncharacterized protein LOC129594704 isoform X1 [Paramacrobiotus metropolitanus]|uniref:uncharacterized protein LOC129594704 isoform X1 n=1 Tax=Paramacrobiotus metropolitanus TaxID=2943436 RepID=UPI002445DD25|nr:uncharacterized protein LOC129594704 isoform X1 [Paramacrobiotus metropolitanus]
MITGSLLIVGLFVALVIAQGQYAQSPASSAKGCGIPIVVNTVPVPDASRFAGRWYKYRHTGVNTTNQFLDHVPLNRSGIPFSTISATGMILRIEQYNNPNDVECVHRFLVSLYGVNGQCPGKAFRRSTATRQLPVILTSCIWTSTPFTWSSSAVVPTTRRACVINQLSTC